MHKRLLLLTLIVSLFLSSCKPDEEILEYECDEWTTVCDDPSITADPEKIGRKVLVIGIDGFRADAMQATISPFLFTLAQQTTTYFTDKNLIQNLSFSGPNWSSLTNGADWCKHRVTTNGFDDNNLAEFPHFFHYIEQVAPDVNTMSLVNWTPVNTYLAAPYADYAPTESVNDHDVFLMAKNALLQQFPIRPDVLFLQFDELDGAGHSYGFSPEAPEYAATVNTLDSYIDSLVSIVNTKRANGEDWLVFVVSDHGGEGKGHGGKFDNDDVKYTIMFANHPTLAFKQWYSSTQVDVVPTIFEFLGIESAEFNCKKDGMSLFQ